MEIPGNGFLRNSQKFMEIHGNVWKFTEIMERETEPLALSYYYVDVRECVCVCPDWVVSVNHCFSCLDLDVS